MKYLIWFIVIVGAIFGLLWVGGAFHMEDPKVQAQKFRETVKPGMTWKQVVEMKKPRFVYSPSEGVGVQQQDFDADVMGGWVEAGSYPNGFWFEYKFTTKENIRVNFGPKGKVTSVGEGFTEEDIYNLGTGM